MRLTDKRKAALATICVRELARAEGTPGDALSANRKAALDYYWARPRGDEVAGRSKVISTDVADMVNAVLADIVPMISTDAVMEFEAESPEDMQAAAAESRAVNRVLMDDNDGFIEIQEAAKDALLLKNGCLRLLVDDIEEVERHPWPEEASAEERAAVLMPRTAGETRERDGSELVIRRSRRLFRVEAIPIERISYQAGYSGRLQDIRFFAEEMEKTRSDLVAMGIDRGVVDTLSPDGVAQGARLSRAEGGGRGQGALPVRAETRDQDPITCHQCYVMTDQDGDGISERWRVLVAGETVLEAERVEVLPYALGTPFLNPHQVTGESLFDHLRQSQDTKTKLRRGLLDNIEVCNRGRFAYDPSNVNEEDVLTLSSGIRARNPGMALVAIPVVDATSGILAGLNYEDQARTERGGAALDMQRPDRQVVSETAWGTERQMAVREQLASMMARNLAETLIRETGLLLHGFLRRYSQGPMLVTVQGQGQWIDPRDWPARTRLNVKPGMSPGQRGHLQTALQLTMQAQVQAMQSGLGGVLADASTLYRTMIDYLRLAGDETPERRWIDPESPQARQAQQAAAEGQQAQAAEQKQMIQAQIELEAKKIADAREQAEAELGFKYHELSEESRLKVAEMVAKGDLELEMEDVSHEHAIELEHARARASGGGASGAAEGGRGGVA